MRGPLDVLTFMVENLEPGDFKSGTRAALLDLGIPTEMKGYRCLLMVIPMHHADPDASLTKEVYPAIAKQLGYRSWKRVEKQIRDAIAAGWEKGDPAVWTMYFQGGEKPSNMEFISRISEMMELWMACTREKAPTVGEMV